MPQKLPVNNFEWMEDNQDFLKNYNEERGEGYFLKVDLQYAEKINEPHNDLPFLPEIMKIEEVEKLLADIHDKTEYVIYIKNSKQEINHGLVLKKLHRINKLNQNAWLGKK